MVAGMRAPRPTPVPCGKRKLVVFYYRATLRIKLMRPVKNKIDYVEETMNTAHFDEIQWRPQKRVRPISVCHHKALELEPQ